MRNYPRVVPRHLPAEITLPPGAVIGEKRLYNDDKTWKGEFVLLERSQIRLHSRGFLIDSGIQGVEMVR